MFQQGNNYWEIRSKHGRKKIFETPEIMWEAFCGYLKWCEDNPLYETKPFAYQGDVILTKVPKMRAPTMKQLCIFLGVNEAYFRTFVHQLPEGEIEFNTVIKKIEDVLYSQKFQGAAADLLNPNIIARDLGLVDKSDTITRTVKLGKELADEEYTE